MPQPTPLANALAQYAPPKQQPSTPLANALMEYAKRVQGDFAHGLDESAQGFGEMVNGQLATGIPRTFLGGLGWMGSPVSGAVSPLLNPIMQPVAQGVHDYVGKPLESATGYPADLTTELALALALPKALHGAGKVVNHSVPYLASLGDAVGKHIGVPEGSYMAGPLPLNRYKAAGLRSQLEPLEASLKKALLAKDATQAAKIREKLNGVRSEISRLDPGGPALDSAASDAILANHLDQSPISSPVGGGSGKVDGMTDFDTSRVLYRGLTRPYNSESGRNYQTFTNSLDDAKEYGPHVVAAHIRPGKNLSVDAGGNNFNAISIEQLPAALASKLRARYGSSATTDQLAHAAKEAGYDSLTVRNVHDTRWGERISGKEPQTVDFVFDQKNISPLKDIPPQPSKPASKVKISAAEKALLDELYKD